MARCDTTEEQLDTLRLALLEATEEKSVDEAVSALVTLIESHPRPLELHLDLHDFAQGLHARHTWPHNFDPILEPLEEALAPWRSSRATRTTTYDSPEQADHASKTFLWIADHVYMFTWSDADTATRWFLHAVAANPAEDKALLGYLEQVFETEYAITEDDLGEIAERSEWLDEATIKRLHLLHLITLHLIHRGPTRYVRDAARTALARGITPSEWQNTLDWLTLHMPAHRAEEDWFSQWTT